MGLFSSSKKTYVSSVVYNMAGPIEDRPDYLKSVILGKVLSTNTRERLATSITNTYLGGTGMRLRSYHLWAKRKYKQIGIPTDAFLGKPHFNGSQVEAALLAEYGINAAVDWIDSGAAEIDMWGRQWLRANMPSKEPTDTWVVDYVEATGEALITFNDGTAPVLFDPVGYRGTGNWIYISYSRPVTINRWTDPLLFIYEYGTGSPALDVLFQNSVTNGEYLPFIPIRHESKFLSETYKPQVYKEAKKAYKRATGSDLKDLIDDISDNPDLDDIDFTYLVFGVPFNTVDMASRRYMFDYFTYLFSNQANNSAALNNWLNSQTSTNSGIAAWKLWLEEQEENPVGQDPENPAPYRPTVTAAPSNSVIIQDNGPGQTNLKLEITWNDIQKTTGAGLGKPGAKKGDVWFTFAGGQEIVARAYTADEVENLTIDTIEAYSQISELQYEKLTIRGLKHTNHIYDGKSVEITAAQALLDDDESGFVIPLHFETFKDMSLVDATQMASQCMNLVFNCYQVVKKKWYQKGIFKLVLVVAVIAISIYFPPAGAATSSGLLGASATVGAALGFTGMAAVIAGTVANLVAAMILTKLITVASVELLGEKLGYIIAAIASFTAISIGSQMAIGQSAASSWHTLMEPMNLLRLTNSVGNAYAQVLNVNTMDTLGKIQDAAEEYRQQSLELQENYAQQFGYGSAYFNPLDLTEAGQGFFTETSETFLSRTLLTGSDIAQMGVDMITNFADLTLKNEFKE